MKNILDFVKAIALVLLAGFAVSCNQKGDFISQSEMRTITVGTASTRTTIGYEGSDVSHLEWVDSDKVAYVSDVPGDLFRVAEVSSNVFTAEIPSDADNIFVIYPVGENEGKTLDQVKATLVSEIEQYADSDFNGELLPMYAYSPVPSGNRVDVVYNCIASVLRFTIFGEGFEEQSLQSVKLSTAEGLAGNFTLNLSDNSLSFESSTNEIVVNYKGDAEDVLLDSSHNIYMVVPSWNYTDVDLCVTTDVDTYSWSDGSMDLTSPDRRLYRIELDLAKSEGVPQPAAKLFVPILSLDEVTEDGTYLIAVKYNNKYYVTNNVPTDISNYYYLQGVEVASNEQGVIYSEDVMNYTWEISLKEGGYEFYSANMHDQGIYGLLLITQGGSGMFSNEDGYEGKVWFVTPEEADGYSSGQQSRRYWDIELDGTGKAILRNKYDRGVGMFPCYKYCTFHDYFTLCFEGGEDKEDIQLLKLVEQ